MSFKPVPNLEALAYSLASVVIFTIALCTFYVLRYVPRTQRLAATRRVTVSLSIVSQLIASAGAWTLYAVYKDREFRSAMLLLASVFTADLGICFVWQAAVIADATEARRALSLLHMLTNSFILGSIMPGISVPGRKFYGERTLPLLFAIAGLNVVISPLHTSWIAALVFAPVPPRPALIVVALAGLSAISANLLLLIAISAARVALDVNALLCVAGAAVGASTCLMVAGFLEERNTLVRVAPILVVISSFGVAVIGGVLAGALVPWCSTLSNVPQTWDTSGGFATGRTAMALAWASWALDAGLVFAVASKFASDN
jgi:hypothetical protein